jgi:uncharacterized membrane protein YfcA
VTSADALAIFLLASVAAFTQSLSGFGFSLLIVPPLAWVIGPRDAVVLANLLGACLNAAMAWRLRTVIEWRLGLTMLAAAGVGMPFGLAVLLVLDPTLLRVIIAVTVLVSTFILWRGFGIRTQSRAGDLAAGFVSGVLNTSTSMSGPPVVLYLQGRGLAPLRFRGTLGAFFLASSSVAMVLFVAGGRIRGETGLQLLAAAPALGLGYAAGGIVYSRMHTGRFRQVVMTVLVASALLSLLSIALA